MSSIELLRDLGIFSIAGTTLIIIINKTVTKRIEEYRSQLEMLFFKYSKYHEKRLDVISLVYSNLAHLHSTMQQLTAIIKFEKEDFKREERQRLEETMGAFEAFRNHFSRNRIFISRELCDRLEDLRVRYYNALFEYTYSNEHRDHEISVELSKSVQIAVNKTIPELLSSLEVEFREEISVDDKGNKHD